MSVVVAIKDKGRVVVGADTRGSTESGFYTDSYVINPKAVHVNKEKNVIAAVVGNPFLLDILLGILNEEKNLDTMDRSYIVRRIVPKLYAQISNYCMRHSSEGELDGELFIAVKDKAYCISSGLSVFEVEDEIALGAGDEVSLGSLFTSKAMKMSPEARIELAIRATASTINSVSNEPYIGDTAGNEFKIMNNFKSKNLKDKV